MWSIIMNLDTSRMLTLLVIMAVSTLKPEEFTEGMRHDLAIRFNENFCIYNSIMMGHTLIPSQSSKIIKTPTSNSEFGASYTPSKSMILGRMTMGGILLRSKSKYDLTHNLTLKVNVQLTDKPHSLINFEYKGRDYRAQFQVETGAPYSSVSPHLSLGTQVFWAGGHGKYTFGHALRYNTNKMVSTAQFNGSGMATLSYVHKASEKVCLVSDFICNSVSKNVTASFGYDYKLREPRLIPTVLLPVHFNGTMMDFLSFLRTQFLKGSGALLGATVIQVGMGNIHLGMLYVTTPTRWYILVIYICFIASKLAKRAPLEDIYCVCPYTLETRRYFGSLPHEGNDRVYLETHNINCCTYSFFPSSS